jgi:hypothetical protein
MSQAADGRIVSPRHAGGIGGDPLQVFCGPIELAGRESEAGQLSLKFLFLCRRAPIRETGGGFLRRIPDPLADISGNRHYLGE